MPERVDRRPLLRRVYGFVTRGDSWMRVTAISKCELRLRTSSTPPVIGAALCGSGVHASGMCPSPASRPRRRIEADPARAGQIHFAPGVQIGEVLVRAARAVERFQVGLELDEVAADEPRREAADGAAAARAASAESRHEPLPFVSVSSGVCTPGSMRMR